MQSRSKRIQIVCPAKAGTQHGNRVTALRWQAVFRRLGHRPSIVSHAKAECDLLVALHASRSAAAIASSKQAYPDRPTIVAITGTDLYQDLTAATTQRSLQLADRLVILQPLALDTLPKAYHSKSRLIYQSVVPLRMKRPQNWRRHQVIVAGHLRPVKDPLRAAMAARQLPPESKIEVHHYGQVIGSSILQSVEREMRKNARYQWHGEIPRGELRRRLARCWLMVLSSRMEGGANVLSEAIVNHTPVLASRIAGSIGLLGPDYEGYFDVGNTVQLRRLFVRCETDVGFYDGLQKQVIRQAPLFSPTKERHAWKSLLDELF